MKHALPVFLTMMLVSCARVPAPPAPQIVLPESNAWGAKVYDVVQISDERASFPLCGKQRIRVNSLYNGKHYDSTFEHDVQPGQFYILWTNNTYTHATQESAAACCRWLHQN